MSSHWASTLLLATVVSGVAGGCSESETSAPPKEVVRRPDVPSLPVARRTSLRRPLRTVAVGELSTCAIRNGGLYCWGTRIRVPFGVDEPRGGTFYPSDPPLPPHRVGLPARAVQVVIGESQLGSHGVVLLDDGRVLTWGRSLAGERGNGECSVGHWLLPEEVELPQPAVEIAALGGRTCVRFEDGGVACWSDVQGRCRPELTTPQPVMTPGGEPLKGMVRIEVDLAFDAEGVLYAWGNDAVGQVSREPDPASRYADELIARRVPRLSPVVDAANAGFATCVVDRDGLLSCWGDPTFSTNELSATVEEELVDPVPVPGVPASRDIVCSLAECLSTGLDGVVYHFGEGTYFFNRMVTVARPRSMTVSARGGCLDEDDVLRCWRDALYGAVLERPLDPRVLREVRLML